MIKHFKVFAEIEMAVMNGETVYWKTFYYKVKFNPVNGFYVKADSYSITSLYHADGIGSEYKPDEFFKEVSENE